MGLNTPAARLRRIAWWLLLLLSMAMLPALLLGPRDAIPALRALLPGLRACWGDAVAQVVADHTLQLLDLLGQRGGPVHARGALLLRLCAQLLPQSVALLEGVRSWPQRLVAHLCALSCWLGLLYPLVCLHARWCRSAWQDRASPPELYGGAEAQARLPLPACATLLMMLWLATPLDSLVWAPLCAAVCLLSLARDGEAR